MITVHILAVSLISCLISINKILIKLTNKIKLEFHHKAGYIAYSHVIISIIYNSCVYTQLFEIYIPYLLCMYLYTKFTFVTIRT